MIIKNPIIDLDKMISPHREARLEAQRQQQERLEERRRRQRERDQDPAQMTEKKMLMYLARHFDSMRNKVFVRSMLLGWEMDFCMVTGSRILHEVEVKVSLSDWKADSKKAKWTHKNQSKVGRFWYAVPGELMNKRPDLPEHVGLLTVSPNYVTVFRAAKLISSYKVTDAELNKLYEAMYFRWWTKALRAGEV